MPEDILPGSNSHGQTDSLVMPRGAPQLLKPDTGDAGGAIGHRIRRSASMNYQAYR
jgi:hypothetical protein